MWSTSNTAALPPMPPKRRRSEEPLQPAPGSESPLLPVPVHLIQKALRTCGNPTLLSSDPEYGLKEKTWFFRYGDPDSPSIVGRVGLQCETPNEFSLFYEEDPGYMLGTFTKTGPQWKFQRIPYNSFNPTVTISENDYESVKSRFEDKFFKCMEPPMFVKVSRRNEKCIHRRYSYEDLLHFYANVFYYDNNHSLQPFVERWVKDPTARTFECVVMYCKMVRPQVYVLGVGEELV